MITKTAHPVKHAVKSASSSIHKAAESMKSEEKSTPAPSAQKPEPQPKPEDRVRAYVRLVQLNAAPSVTFDADEQVLYDKISAEANEKAEKERQSEIQKNRKILGLGPSVS